MAFRDDDATGQFRYLEGYVELRRSKDQYQKVFCILYANTLSFYEQKRTLRELERTKPLEVATITFKKTSFKVDELKLTVKNASKLVSSSDLKLRFTTTEERDNWYIRLHTICYGGAPTDIPLLPGQQQIAKDILQLEAKRSTRRLSSPSINHDSPPTSPPPEPPQPRRQSSTHYPHTADRDQFNLFPPGHPLTERFPPMWFFGKIPRHHAEQILKDNPRYGDILIRASESTQGPGEFSLSVRQTSRDGHSVIRHYKLNRIKTSSGLNGYKLDIDEHHKTMSSVYELLLFFIEKSGGSLKLFETQDSKVLKMPDNLYENRFSEIFSPDPDNGEVRRTSSHRPPNLSSKGSFVKNQTPPWVVPQEDDYLSPDINPGINHSYANTTNPVALAADDASQMRPSMPPLPRIREEGNSNPANMSRSMRK